MIRKLRLTSKLMTLPPGKQTEELPTLPTLPLPLPMPILSKSSSCKSIFPLLEGTSHEQNTQSSYLNYLFQTSFHLGSSLYYALWCKKSSIICTTFFLLNTSWGLGSLGKFKVWISFTAWIFFTLLIFHQSAYVSWIVICFS